MLKLNSKDTRTTGLEAALNFETHNAFEQTRQELFSKSSQREFHLNAGGCFFSVSVIFKSPALNAVLTFIR